MPSKKELERIAFHRRQMDALPTLISGLDPDPPVILCSRTQRFDELVCQQLRSVGWPASGKSAEQRKTDPPSPVKGKPLARKLAHGNDLNDDDIVLLAHRIAWLQRNWFRWSARNGYERLEASKTQVQTSSATAEADDYDVRTPQPKESDKAETEPVPDAQEAPDFPDRSAQAGVELRQVKSPQRETTSATISTAEAGADRTCGTANTSSRGGAERPDQSSAREEIEARCDAALASLEITSAGGDMSSSDDHFNGNGEFGAVQSDHRFIALRTGHINSVDGDKVRRLLFAIFYQEPHEEIVRRARSLAADEAQLAAALSGAPPTAEDIREAFAKLGLETDV